MSSYILSGLARAIFFNISGIFIILDLRPGMPGIIFQASLYIDRRLFSMKAEIRLMNMRNLKSQNFAQRAAPFREMQESASHHNLNLPVEMSGEIGFSLPRHFLRKKIGFIDVREPSPTVL